MLVVGIVVCLSVCMLVVDIGVCLSAARRFVPPSDTVVYIYCCDDKLLFAVKIIYLLLEW